MPNEVDQRHQEFVDELAAQLDEYRMNHRDMSPSLLLVDDANNDIKYVLTDVRWDGKQIVAAVARL